MSPDLTSRKSLSIPLLATRFFLPPLPAACVPRARLIGLLEKGLRLPATLVSAPPGFGKSSLLSEWIHNRPGLRAGWLSLEPSDQDWGIFFRYLAAAWQHIFPQAGETALAELNLSPAPDREALANLLLNDLLAGQEAGAADHALLVLDDYHRIETAAIHETVAYLIEHLPPRCHLVLLTRADPPLPVARWRSRGQLLEVRADDLRFTPAEAAEYLNQSMSLGLTEEQICILLERTEGWIVGLQMAALAMKGFSAQGSQDASSFVRDFGGSNRFVVDYLVEEVVRQQPEEIQQFLLATAQFDQFCGPLCDAIMSTAAPYSQTILERLEKANLFLIALDDTRQWFRYHHLFAELLRLRVRQQTDSVQILSLYRCAAEWFSQNGLWRDSIRYALQTKDMDFCADLFEQAILKGGLDFLYSGMQPLIDPFPSALLQQRPLLSLAKAVAIFETSQLDGIVPLLRFAEKGILASPPFPGQEDVLGWIYVVQSNVASQLGDHTWMVEASQRMPKWIPNDFITNVEALIQVGRTAYYEGNLLQTDTCWQQALDLAQASGNTYYTLSLLNGLGRLGCQKGELNQAGTYFQQAFDLLEKYRGQYLIWLGAMQRDYSDWLRDRNRLKEARDLAVSAIPLLEKWHTISALGWGLISAAKIMLAFQDLPGAQEMLNKVDELRRRYTLYPDLEALAQISRARLLLEEGDTGQAWQMLETCLNSACCQSAMHREWALTSQARVLVRTGRPAEALPLLAGLPENAKANGRGRYWLALCLVEALAYHALGDTQNAFQLLGDGLTFAQAKGIWRAPVDEGEPMRTLLEAFRVQFPQSPLADYVSDILALFPAPPAPAVREPLKIEGLYETLSPREMDILRLVCLGYSNREIADQLVLSVGTVKFHIHNIFGKLDVRDRPQAIAKASLLGLKRNDRSR